MGYFPFFVDLNNKTGLIIGGGKQALEKIERFRPYGVKLHIIAPDFLPEIMQDTTVTLSKREFIEQDLDTFPDFVIASTEEKEVNQRILALCRERRILVNSVDDLEHCDFIFPSLIKRGKLSIGICTAGASPSVGIQIKKKIEQVVPDKIEEILDWLQEKRPQMLEIISNKKQRFACYHTISQICMEENRILTEEEYQEIVKEFIKEQ